MQESPQNVRKRLPGLPKTSRIPATDGVLRDLAFDNSAHANIITSIRLGNVIVVNRAACRLLGYAKKELLTRKRADIFDTKTEEFKKMLKQRAGSGQSTASVTAIKKSGKLITCEITSAIFKDESGLKRAIYTITDVSKRIVHQKNLDIKKNNAVAGDIIKAQVRSDARLAENNDWIKYIAKTSYDVMWDWDVLTGKIYVGDSIEEVFGYNVQNKIVHFGDFINCLLPGERDSMQDKLLKTLAGDNKSWDDSYSFRRNDGSVASTVSRASIIRDDEGKAIRLIGATQDVSRLQELERRINNEEKYSEEFLQVTKLSLDVIWDWNLLTGKIYVGEGFEELFGYVIQNNTTDIADLRSHVYPDDQEMVAHGLSKALQGRSSLWEQAYRYVRKDGSIATVFDRANITRHPGGKAHRMIGILQDISKQEVLRATLEQQIKLKDQQIAEAKEEGRESERSHIGKELHDNINQLLGASRLYLTISKRGGKDSEMFLNRSAKYTLTAIEEIRKLTKVLTTDVINKFGLCESIDTIIRDSTEIGSIKISAAMETFMEDSVDDKFKLNVFRIIQEQLNNILNHAKATEVTISLLQTKQSIVLSISDNGIGFDVSKQHKGIGISNITSRAKSYKGLSKFTSQPGKGCSLTVSFPLADEKTGIEVSNIPA